MDAERGPDGRYAVVPEPTLWADLGFFGCLLMMVGTLGTAWPFIVFALWLIGD